jgi:large subunit ribosomal protein L19
MSQALLEYVGSKSIKKAVPTLKPGFTVKVHQRIKEGAKERVQMFEGLIIAISSGHGVNKTFTVRKIVDGIGVEKIFPFFSPNIEKIEITKKGRVRRAKLYYMRDRSGKSARLKDQPIGKVEMWGYEEKPEPVAETVTEEKEATETAETPKVEAKTEEAPVTEEVKTEAPATEEKAEEKTE